MSPTGLVWPVAPAHAARARPYDSTWARLAEDLAQEAGDSGDRRGPGRPRQQRRAVIGARHRDEPLRSFIFFTHDRASTQTLELFAGEVMPQFARLRPVARQPA